MDLSDAREALLARGFSYLEPARADIMLNNAKNELEDTYPWPWLETTATGTAPLSFDDLKYVLYVVDTTNQQELVGSEAPLLVDQDPSISTSGTPLYWWLDGTTTLNLYPTNTSVQLSVRYVKFSPELSDDGQTTPLIPERYHPIWVDLAAVEAYKDDDEQDRANALLVDVQRRIQQMIVVYASRNRQNSTYQKTSLYSSGDW